MRRIEWTWQDGTKSYSIPFVNEAARFQIDFIKSKIIVDPSFDGASVNLVEADIAPIVQRPELMGPIK